MNDIEEINKIERESDCLCDSAEIDIALDKMASAITLDFKEKKPLILCVMTGGIIPVGHLTTKLNFPLQIDYIHVSRYQDKIKGGELHWIKEPSISLEGRNILIVDDIFDEGVTLFEIDKYCKENGAKHVSSAVLINKIHNRKINFKIDYIGLDIEDRYLFGFGMDYKGYLRNVNAIHAVKGL